MRTTTMAGAIIAFAIILAACGGDETSEPTPTQAPVAAAPETAAPAGADVKSGDSDLGAVLTGPEGLTLYGFTNDVDATSTCYGTCADAWPPVIVDVDFQAGPGLDFGIFATTVREDGRLQLVAGKWPLYYFAGDAGPGDVNGQGSGDVWFAVDTDGILIEEAVAADSETGSEPATEAAAPVATATVDLGEILVDAEGLTLYGFINDIDGVPTCNDACADAWPPVLVDGSDLPDGLDPEVFSVVELSDGTSQLKAGRWPLYLFAGDAAPGDVNGQGSGGVWFVAASDGSLIGAPAADGEAAAEDSGSDY